MINENIYAADENECTALMRAVRKKSSADIKNIIEILPNKPQSLNDQFSYTNKKNQNVWDIVLEEKFFDDCLVKQKYILSGPEETIKFLIEATIKINSPTIQEKEKLVSLIKEYLPTIVKDEIEELANIVFQKNLYELEYITQCSHYKNLHEECASSKDSGEKIFNSIDVELIESFYVAVGVNLKKHETFIESLRSIKDEDLEPGTPTSAVILESNKQKILQIIKSADILDNFIKEPSTFQGNERDLINAKDLALKRCCFLLNNETRILENSEAEFLLKFVSNVYEVLITDLKSFYANTAILTSQVEELLNSVPDSEEELNNTSGTSTPILKLFQISNDKNQISKLKSILNKQYEKVTSTVKNCFAIISKYYERYISLEVPKEKNEVKKELLKELPQLTEDIHAVLKNDEVKKVKNIKALCTEVSPFLNISPLASLFEEYDKKYQTYEGTVEISQKTLGDMEVNWNLWELN